MQRCPLAPGAAAFIGKIEKVDHCQLDEAKEESINAGYAQQLEHLKQNMNSQTAEINLLTKRKSPMSNDFSNDPVGIM